MTVYTCEAEWETMLTCLYEVFAGRKGHANVRLMKEPIEQYTLFDEYIHVDADPVKAEKMMDAINLKISPHVYHELAYCSLAYEPDALDNIYRVLVLGFAFGPGVLNMTQYRDVMRNYEIRKRVGNEAHHFREFLRFHQVGEMYIAHFEPKSRVVTVLGANFQDRMPSEHWMIVDDVHLEAVVHPKNEHYYHRKLTGDELQFLLKTENENDEYTDLWRAFFKNIAIKERENPVCQRNLFPIWKRKHAVEFL